MRLVLGLLALCGVTAAAIQTCSPSSCITHAITADLVILVDVSSALGGQNNFIAVQNFLSNFTSQLTYSPEDTQIALYSYATYTQSLLSLNQGSTSVAVQNAIQSLNYDATNDRQLYTALNREESEVTVASGFRAGYKHMLLIVSADAFTGPSVIGSSLLQSVQAKYDLVMTIGYGSRSASNQVSQLQSVTGSASNVFFAFNSDQLTYAAQWLSNYACPGAHVSSKAPSTTVMPTQNPMVPCSLSSLNYDVYLVIDTSNAISASDFSLLLQSLGSFAAPFPVGNGQEQFAIVTTSIDSELYYTGFHQGQTRAQVLQSISLITQDSSTGQTLKLSLQAIQASYLSQNYISQNKLLVYVTGTTNFDTDPNAMMASLSQQYGLKAVAVQWTSNADMNALTSFTGGSNCVYSATTSSTRANLAVWLQTQMCNKQFCL